MFINSISHKYKRFSYSFFLFCLFIFFNKSSQAQKPNIIVILGDDIGYKTLDINGGKSYATPNLDAMAKNGMNFTECHASPLCSPSRFMMLTGKYNFRNYTTWGIMDASQKTIANMLKDAGYKTACFGKWQLDGGETSVHKFGFDSYCIWLPFDGGEPSRYKNPVIYANNAFVPDSLTLNKYGEDIMADSVMNFIERNKAVPFFIYYPMLLAHPPFQPTPDDGAFATWTFPSRSDTSFYSSMIKYMDKKIGQIINKVNQAGIRNNTLIIYVGDNGTPPQIIQNTTDGTATGGKGLSTESGTRVPMIIDWPGTVKAGSINNDLIGFTDFLPTLAHAANISIPDYGPLDGIDFLAQIRGNTGTPRDWLFYDFDAHPGIDSLKRWAQTKEYKLYDTSLYNSVRLFYNIIKDPNELNPIPPELLTPDELKIKQELLKVINGYVKQGIPILGDAYVSNITSASAILNDSVKVNGGSTIKAGGVVWSDKPDAVYPSSPHTLDGTLSGPYQSLIKSLKTNTVYYARAYAKNIAGITYSNQIKFRTLLNTPAATAATLVSNTKFTANWHSINAASGYKLYVSTKPAFIITTPGSIDQKFNNGITPPQGWTFTGSIGINDTIHNAQSPAIQFKASKAQVITRQLTGPASSLKFWIKGLSTDTASYFLTEGFNGSKWIVIKSVKPLSTNGVTKTFDSTSGDTLPANITQFRFTYYKSKGTLAFDDVQIKYNTISNSFVKGYNGLQITDTTSAVTGLKPGTNYYYRIKAITGYNTSDNSNTIPVITCLSLSCNQSVSPDNGITDESVIKVFPNPTSNNFILSIDNRRNIPIEIVVTDVYGKTVYRQESINNDHIVFGKEFNPGIYFIKVMKDGKTKTLKLIKQ